MKHSLARVVARLALAAALLLPLPGPAAADAAPEPKGSTGVGSVLHPYNFVETRVRLLDEQVVLTVEPAYGALEVGDDWDSNANINSLNSQVRVRADFHLRNLGQQPEQMQVVFPLTDLQCPTAYGPPSYTVYSHELDPDTFAVTVDGKAVTTREATTTVTLPPRTPGEPEYMRECLTTWRQFPVTFPVGQDVRIRVTYTMRARATTTPWSSFVYILKSGQGWYGSIGEIDLRLELPYPANRENISRLPAGYRITGSSVRWRWTDIEPLFNLQVEIMDLNVWPYLQKRREEAAQHPTSADAWARLAQACRLLAGPHSVFAAYGTQEAYQEGVLFERIEGWDFAQQAVTAYQHAIRLEPRSVQLRFSLGQLLASMSLSANNGRLRPEYKSVQLALRELNHARLINEETHELPTGQIEKVIGYFEELVGQ